MIESLFLSILARFAGKFFSTQVLKDTKVGGILEIKSLARGIRMGGGKWKVKTIVLERTA